MRRANDIPASIINVRLSVAQKYGADRALVLQESGLTEEELALPTNRVSVEKTLAVWRSILDQTNNHNIGLESGAKITLSSLGLLGYLMMNSSTMLKAFDKLCTYQRLVNAISFYKKEVHGSEVTYRLELQVEWHDLFRYTFDFIIAGLYSVFKKGTTTDVEPIEIGFSFPKPENHEYYYEFFGSSKVYFDVKDSYVKFDKKQLESSLVGYNPELYEYFEKQLINVLHEHDNVNQYQRKVEKYILQHLNAEIPSISDIASAMAMSVRSLQLALKKENTTYQNILNTVRKEFSIGQLKTSKFNITEIAFITGFSDVSAFSRKFKSWTGLTPTQYQEQLLL